MPHQDGPRIGARVLITEQPFAGLVGTLVGHFDDEDHTPAVELDDDPDHVAYGIAPHHFIAYAA